jgi:hypothetical protein
VWVFSVQIYSMEKGSTVKSCVFLALMSHLLRFHVIWLRGDFTLFLDYKESDVNKRVGAQRGCFLWCRSGQTRRRRRRRAPSLTQITRVYLLTRVLACISLSLSLWFARAVANPLYAYESDAYFIVRTGHRSKRISRAQKEPPLSVTWHYLATRYTLRQCRAPRRAAHPAA